MSDPSWERVKEVAYAAMLLPAAERGPYVAQTCGEDPELRAEVESLLAADAELDAQFLASPLMAATLGPDRDALSGPTPGALVAGRFCLIRELGEGGMGTVWLAEQSAPVRRLVALKFIRAGMYDAAVAQRFASEQQSLAIMDHPAIAKVFEAGLTPQGQPYFVMEYVPGQPITTYCDEHQLSVAARLALFIQACDGVQHAHQKAVLHRDLKPANILVVEIDGQPVPRIIDFGLAKAIGGGATKAVGEDAQLTRFGQMFGTLGYMSPEQANPDVHDVDTRADVYSLGVILYVLLTGQKPFENRQRAKPPLDQQLRELRQDEPPPPSSKVSGDRESSLTAAAVRATAPAKLVSTLRGDLDWITMKALERDRERRYGTPSELAADLRRYLRSEPVVARPATAGYQIAKFIRRHRVTSAAAALVTLLAIVAAASAVVAVQQRRVAEFHERQALRAQAGLLTQSAAQRLKDEDMTGAQGIILEVLLNPAFRQTRTPAALGVFQSIRAADSQLAVLSGHRRSVHSAQYSPDGTRVVTASDDYTARIWDATTGLQLVLLKGHTRQLFTAEYSRDGKRIVTSAQDKSVRIWDATTGAELAKLMAPDAKVVSASFAPDGSRIVAASLDKTARVLDAGTGAQLAVLSGHAEDLQDAVYSPDGTQIATASLDKTARLWAARTGAPLGVLAGHEAMVLRVRYSPDGQRVVTASADMTARVWDVRTGRQLLVLAGHSNRVYWASYSRDGSRIVTASDDGTARIWDATSGALLKVLSGHGGFVRGADFSSDGARVVTASSDGTARLWVVRNEAEVATLAGHRDGVTYAQYSHDGAHVVTASLDRTARIWDAATGAPVATLDVGEDVLVAAYSADDSRIVTGGNGPEARIWDAHSGAPLTTLRGHGSAIESAVYCPDGTHLTTTSLDRTARIWDAQSGTELAKLTGHEGPVLSAAYSPDGRFLTTASFDKTARIWDAKSGEQLRVLSGHDQIVSDSSYSPDGKRLVTASIDKTARIWDAQTGEPVLTLTGHTGPVQSARYSPDGREILTASVDQTVRIWDAATGLPLAVFQGHRDAVQFAAYAPDGKHLVTASLDKTARIWDARIPADLDRQVLWDAAAQTDRLTQAERAGLELPADARVRVWQSPASDCDHAAAAVYDPKRVTAGITREGIAAAVAVAACGAELAAPRHAARTDYEMGRGLAKQGDAKGATKEFERALDGGYPAAAVDLADLLAAAGAPPEDLERARALYERAWREHVAIAAFRLGTLYEAGAKHDEALAWEWYRRGADAGEPHALARFAERDETRALGETDSTRRNALLLAALTGYAAAADYAYREDWPDDAWRHWRFRRATLARVLARGGLMGAAADAFAGARSAPL